MDVNEGQAAWIEHRKLIETIKEKDVRIENLEALLEAGNNTLKEKDDKIAGLMDDFVAHEQEIRVLKADSCYITNAELKTKIKELEARIEDLNEYKNRNQRKAPRHG